MTTRTLRAGRRSVDVSNADKVFFPSDRTAGAITKGALAEYYQHIAPTMIRHLRGRPVAAERYPDGITAERVFQKNVPAHFPGWIPRVDVPNKEGGTTTHAVCENESALVYLADQATITPHTWLSRTDKLDAPDRLIFDLDPSSDDPASLRFAVRRVRELLEELGLVCFLMTTGSRGFHVVAPLRRDHDFDSVRAFARQAAAVLADRHPERLTVEQRKDQRGNRVFLDYLRNAYAQTSVPPYAVRARRRAPVATPLWWDELDLTDPQRYTIENLPDRVCEVGDPWSRVANRARSLRQPRRRLWRLLQGAR